MANVNSIRCLHFALYKLLFFIYEDEVELDNVLRNILLVVIVECN